MIPVSLTLKGINSYQKQQTIDFTKLMEGQLFGIFGPVGGGKSTILEAISFALYGETERLNRNDNRGYNLMNLKSNEMLIDFIFWQGTEENLYRFQATGNRSKSNFDKVTPTRVAYKKQQDSWIPIEVGEVENIIGLNYENFRRTIIIPQGKFSEFLQLGDSARTQMLKEIFRLERFEMFYKVAFLEKKNNETKNILKGRIDQFGTIDEQLLESKRKELVHLEEQDKKNLDSLYVKQKEEQKQTSVKELFEKLEKQRNLFDSLQFKQEFYNALQINVQNYEDCFLNFKTLLDKKHESNSTILNYKDQLKELKKVKEQIGNHLFKDEEIFKELKFIHDSKEQRLREIEELEKIRLLKSLDKEIQLLNERIKRGTSIYEQSCAEIETLNLQKDKLSESLKSKKQQLPDLAELTELKNWFTLKKGILEMQENYSKEIQHVQKSILSLQEKRGTIFSLEVIKSLDKPVEEFSSSELLKYFNEIIKDTYKEIRTTEQTLEHLVIQSKLEDYALNLREDLPCPLCGSTHHPEILAIENVKIELINTRKKKSDLELKLKSLDDAIAELRDIQTQLDAEKKSLVKEQQKLSEQQDKMKVHELSFKSSTFSKEDESKVLNAIKSTQLVKAEIEKAEEEEGILLKKIDEVVKNREKYAEGLNKLNLDLNTKDTESKLILKQIKEISYNDFILFNEREISTKIEDIKANLHKAEQQYLKLDEKINEARKKRDELTGQVLQLEKNLEIQKQQNQKIESELDLKLKDSHYQFLDRVENILNSSLDLQDANHKLRAFQQTFHTASEQLNILVIETKGKQFNVESYNTLLSEIEFLKRQSAESKEELGKCKSIIEKLSEDLTNKKKLEEDLSTIELKAEDINTLKQLFKGSGFVNYVSSVFLQNLCSTANERFYKLTRQKLRLEMTENSNFQVRDFLNNGQVRSVKTLSGGQTFQAALSLALALAENIQEQTKAKQNFFFLDEGFGSQDKESLITVFDTLKSLRKENRIVGVISHVEELQQEIDINLHVYNNEEQGSIIKCSWES